MQPYTREAEWAIRLLIYVGGVATTVAGSWIASKIRVYHDNRNLHRDDLKQRDLVPLRAGLIDSYLPLAGRKVLAIRTNWGDRALNESAKLTEEPLEMGVMLITEDPRPNVEANLDEALFADARQHHYERLVSEWQGLASRWSAHVRECERWVSRIADRILTESGLPPFQAPDDYVMHLYLALFLYQRLFGFPTRPLAKSTVGHRPCLANNSITVALGDDQKMDKLLATLDEIRETEREPADELMAGSRRMAEEFATLSNELGLAIAERKLYGRCRMVGFL